MAIKVRDLLARVLMLRPDVREKNGDEFGLWAIQEAVRTVCRTTGLMIIEQDVAPLYANTHSTALFASGYEVYRAVGVSCANLPGTEANPTTYLGTFSGSDGSVNPSYGDVDTIVDGNASSVPTNGFFICSEAGSLQVDNITQVWEQWDKGDVILSDGLYWKQYKKDAFSTVGITSRAAVEHWFNCNQSPRNFPAHTAQDNGSLYWYPPTRYDTAVRIALSVVPNLIDWSAQDNPNSTDIDDINLPIEAESVILDGALETMFRVPHSDPKMTLAFMKQADMYRMRFKKGMTGLRAAALIGQSGSSWYSPSNFAGRTNKFTPWRSENWWL